MSPELPTHDELRAIDRMIDADIEFDKESREALNLQEIDDADESENTRTPEQARQDDGLFKPRTR